MPNYGNQSLHLEPFRVKKTQDTRVTMVDGNIYLSPFHVEGILKTGALKLHLQSQAFNTYTTTIRVGIYKVKKGLGAATATLQLVGTIAIGIIGGVTVPPLIIDTYTLPAASTAFELPQGDYYMAFLSTNSINIITSLWGGLLAATATHTNAKVTATGFTSFPATLDALTLQAASACVPYFEI